MFEFRWLPDGSLEVTSQVELIHNDGSGYAEVVTRLFRFPQEDLGKLRHVLAMGMPMPKVAGRISEGSGA